MKKRSVLFSLGCALALAALPAAAQLGKQPIRMVVSAPAGNAPDVMARILGEQLRMRFGQPVVIDNRGGAGGILAVNAAKGAEANGTTLLFVMGSVAVITPHTFKEAKFDMERDFDMVGAVAYTPMMFVANVEKGPKTWAEAVQLLKSQPGALSLGNPTRTSIPHLAGELAGQLAGGSFQHVAFSGSGPAIQAVVNGDTLVSVDGTAPLMPLAKAGRVRALAVTADKPLPGLESIPLAHDQLPGLDVSGWFMLFTSKGTPRPVLDQLNQALNAALKAPEMLEKMRDFGNYPLGGSVADGSAFLQKEKQRWAEVIRKANLQPE